MSSSPDPIVSKPLTHRGDATRKRLIDAARDELLEADGVLEVARVAERAQVSPGLLYRYFGAKDGLVAAVVHHFYDAYDDAVFAVPFDGPDWMTTERRRVAAEVDFLYDEPLARLVIGRQLKEVSAGLADAERLAAQIDMAAKNVARGQALGQVDGSIDARLVAAAFLGAFREVMAEAMRREEAPTRAELVETITRLGSTTIPATEA